MKKLGRLLAVCALLGLLLTGCNMPLEENRQVEDQHHYYRYFSS